MKFRNPWIDPRITQARPDDVRAYLTRHDWHPVGPASDPRLVRYELTDHGEDAPTLFLPARADTGPALQWIIELVEELARYEDRWAVDVLGDILCVERPTSANGPGEARRKEPATDRVEAN